MRRTDAGRALLPVLALLAATACTGGGGGGGEGGREPSKPPRLKKLWSVPAADRPAMPSPDEDAWLGKGVLALRTGDTNSRLVGHSAASGEQRWNLPLPKGTTGVCALSGQVNKEGIGGVLLDAGDGDERCTVAAAVDIRRGTVLWTEPLGRKSEPSGSKASVSVSGKTLTATVGWNDLARFRLDGDGKGRELPGLPHFRDGGANPGPVDHDGRHIAVETRSGFALYDADEGTRLWHRPARSRDAALDGLVSADPVVLDTIEKGRRYYRTYRQDQPGVRDRIGKELDKKALNTPLTGRGVLVARFPGDHGAYAYDLRTGKPVWQRGLSERENLEGVRGGALLTTHRYAGPETWVRDRDLRTGAPRTLGRVPGRAFEEVLAWDSRHLYVQDTDREANEKSLTAYALPERGSARDYKTPPKMAGGS
ncbi:hypothetical protein GCM10009801_27110 [Streptomyces albiaxialis]|uniref:Pyrrolo-quinoline quinone repeat domain-containing protein n=1 Tax=Streptomyces albiaxialis TaxID=329523 RepID=A0ABN2VVJ3_9ACTN